MQVNHQLPVQSHAEGEMTGAEREELLAEQGCLQELSEGGEGGTCSDGVPEVVPPLGNEV